MAIEQEQEMNRRAALTAFCAAYGIEPADVQEWLEWRQSGNPEPLIVEIVRTDDRGRDPGQVNEG